MIQENLIEKVKELQILSQKAGCKYIFILADDKKIFGRYGGNTEDLEEMQKYCKLLFIYC